MTGESLTSPSAPLVPHESLIDRYARYRRNRSRQSLHIDLIMGSFGIVFITLLYCIGRLLLWQSAFGPFANEVEETLTEPSRALVLTGLDLHHRVISQAFTSAVLWFMLPLFVIFLLVKTMWSRTTNWLEFKLFNKPTLVRELLQLGERFGAEHKWLLKMLGLPVIALLLISALVGLLLPETMIAPAFAVLGIALAAVVFFSGLFWVRKATGGVLLHRIPTTFIKRAALLSLGRQLVFWTAVAIIFLCASALVPFSVNNHVVKHSGAWIHDLEQWESQVDVILAADAEDSGMVTVARDRVNRKIHKLVDETYAFADVLEDFDEVGVLAICFLLCSCAACLDLGLTLVRLDFREPLIALGIAIVASTGLYFLETLVRSTLPSSGVLSFVSRCGVLLLTFVLGSASMFVMRLLDEQGTDCPVCLNRSASAARCSICEYRLDRSTETALIGNTETRELHAPTCHHLANLDDEKKRELNCLEDALWADYDLCGTCLGGSGYGRMESRRSVAGS